MITSQYIPAYRGNTRGTESFVLVEGRPSGAWRELALGQNPATARTHSSAILSWAAFGRTPLVSASLLIECGSQAALALPNDAVREKCTPKKPLGIHVARNLTRAIFIYCFIYLRAFFFLFFFSKLVLAHMLRTGEIFITKAGDCVFPLNTSSLIIISNRVINSPSLLIVVLLDLLNKIRLLT